MSKSESSELCAQSDSTQSRSFRQGLLPHSCQQPSRPEGLPRAGSDDLHLLGLLLPSFLPTSPEHPNLPGH